MAPDQRPERFRIANAPMNHPSADSKAGHLLSWLPRRLR